MGVPVAGVEVRIAPDGELLVRADSMFTRYVGDPAATARVLVDGWLHTGDRARQLPSGELVITGRVQALVAARDGAPVDTAEHRSPTARRVRGLHGGVRPCGPRRGRSPLPGVCAPAGAAPLPLAGGRRPLVRGRRVVADADPRGVVRGWALYDGAFAQATGEVGPTGKPRGWRIHELRAGDLRPRHSPHGPSP